jgi:hypothetical protein
MHCAGNACVADETVLVVGILDGDTPYGASYQDGKWAAAVKLGDSAHSQSGGGVVATADGHGVAVFRAGGNDSTLNFATWSGTWGMLAAQGGTGSTVSIPVATTDGAFIAQQEDVDPFMMKLGEWSNSSSSWPTAAESTGQAGQNLGVPAVVATATGDPMVLFVDKTTQQYAWTLRTGGTWSASAPLSTATTPSVGASFPAIAACRVGTDQIVAVMVSGSNGQTLLSSTFSSGAWSTPTPLATDLAPDLSIGAMFAVTALPGGRAAVAYVKGLSGVSAGLYDGTMWGPLKDVPISSFAYATTPVSIARGANASAILELAYVDFLSGGIQHTRLTDEGNWTWTAPVVIDAQKYSVVSLAVGP